MSEYDFGISYIKGKENVVANALSRRPRVFSLVPLKVNLRECVLTQLLGDSWYLKVTSNLQSGRQLDPKYEGYSLEANKLLRYRGRMYISKDGDIYATHDLELTVLMLALKLWRHCLVGQIFDLKKKP